MNHFVGICGPLLLAWVSSAPAQETLPPGPADEPGLLRFTDPVANTLGFGPLRESRLSNVGEEIRIWVGFGTISPDAMLRLRIDRDGLTSGTLHLHARSTDGSAGMKMPDWFGKKTAGFCGDLKNTDESRACTVRFLRAPRWDSVYRQLASNDVETLPDESQLPGTNDIMDGTCVLVELLSGACYRAYEYCNPAFRDAPEAQKASAILKTVNELVSRAAAEGSR